MGGACLFDFYGLSWVYTGGVGGKVLGFYKLTTFTRAAMAGLVPAMAGVRISRVS